MLACCLCFFAKRNTKVKIRLQSVERSLTLFPSLEQSHLGPFHVLNTLAAAPKPTALSNIRVGHEIRQPAHLLSTTEPTDTVRNLIAQDNLSTSIMTARKSRDGCQEVWSVRTIAPDSVV